MQNLPSPRDFGWKDSNEAVVKWVPNWMTQSEASKECRVMAAQQTATQAQGATARLTN